MPVALAQGGATASTEDNQAAELSHPPLGATASLPPPATATPPSVTPTASKPAAKVATPKPVTTVSKPLWNELTRRQQEALEPLSDLWDQLSEAHKRKWIALSHNYRSLSDDEKEKLHSRMTEWVTLTVQERIQARLNFGQTKQLAPDNKKAQWEAYQALSDEERQKLASQAMPHPVGAAVPVKPVAPQKLTQLPPPKTDSRQSGKIQTGPHHVDMHTLLPQSQVTSRSTTTTSSRSQ
ncbi:DUF3106 domain-containing protein [Curvibacter sp. HBC61]|uniref:DUF3106 domain-containing protein n=1 Tax=Curvibacter cyanobacteriorum TaxID=3026422 RepID=A0ABT5MZB3_9BURK|nr:DUF3106 domain-containing protein [Curvibacter sp. HBC61]MDD0838103.1 DUF3106 domain-containing protein [Curvibacter sp. HBC61]